ncbi:MAG: glycosyltransferase family 2 protein [Patescibacteria group bacterium]|nr:glycosyltransferase family 2 protein [Patescibacteria group bacterium]
MDLSIIIVNYKTKDLTLQTINSVFKATKPTGKFEVFLIDNASNDDTPETVRKNFPKVKVIELAKNLGFAGGNNPGLRKAKGRYQLLLNSDTIISKDTLIKMIDFMDKNSKIGLSTCRVNLVNGKIDPASHRGFPTPWASLTYYLGLEKLFPKSKLFGQYHQGWKNLKTTHEIDTPVGAFFMLRKKALNQVGLLDETFFMYGEDIDLAIRLKKAGWKVVYTPITKITHLKGASGLNKKVKNKLTSKAKLQRVKTTKAFFKNNKILYKKHYSKKYFFPIKWLFYLGIDILKTIKVVQIRLS